MLTRLFAAGLTFAVVAATAVTQAQAASKEEIDIRVAAALDKLYDSVLAGRELAEKAEGVLVFPRVYKAGFIVGGEYGEGSLLIDGQPVQYYSIASGSVGLQVGAQARIEILMFLDTDALEKFRRSDGWEVGVDGSVALLTVGIGDEIDTKSIKAPIIAFILDNQGLMLNLSLEGSKISKIDR